MRFTLFLLAALVVVSSAGVIGTFGGDARLFIDNPDVIFAYPGTIGNFQFARVTSTSEYDLGYFGGLMDIDGTTWGGLHNHDGYMLSVLYHGGAFGIIAEVDYASDPEGTYYVEGEPITAKIDNMAIDLTFGMEMDLIGDYTDIAVGVSYAAPKATQTVTDSTGTTENTFEDPEMGFDISLRGHDEGALFNLFPIISFGYATDGSKQTFVDSVIYDESETLITFSAGAGMNKMLADNTHFIAGLFLNFEQISSSVLNSDATMSIDILDFHGGIDQQVLGWLSLRAGLTAVTNYEKQGDVDATIATDFTSDFGLGFNVANWTLDATIAEDFLHYGPNAISGYEGELLGEIELTYTF